MTRGAGPAAIIAATCIVASAIATLHTNQRISIYQLLVICNSSGYDASWLILPAESGPIDAPCTRLHLGYTAPRLEALAMADKMDTAPL